MSELPKLDLPLPKDRKVDASGMVSMDRDTIIKIREWAEKQRQQLLDEEAQILALLGA